MDKIPVRQLHQRASTKTALAAKLSDREIGFCDADSALYIKVDGELVSAVEAIGKPLKLIGAATVSYLNGSIPGLEPGWMYTLTDSGTLTAGNVDVEVDDEVAWGASGAWVKIGGGGSAVDVSVSYDAVNEELHIDFSQQQSNNP